MDVKGPEPSPASTDTGPPPAPASASVPSPRPAVSSASLSARMEARLSKGDEVAAHAVAASMLSIMSSTPPSQMSINPGTDTQSLLGATSPRSVAGSFSESFAGSALSRNVSSLGNNAHGMPALLPSGPMSTSAQLAKFPHLALSGLHVPVEPAVKAGGSTKGSATSASPANGTTSSTAVTLTPNGNTAGGATTGSGIVSSVLGKGFDELSFSQQLHIFWCWIDELSQAQRRYIQEGLRRRIAFHDFCEAETSVLPAQHNGHKTLGSTGSSHGNGNASSGSSGNGRVSSPASQSSGSGNSPPSSSGGDAGSNGKRSNSSSDTGWSSKSSGAEAGKGSSTSAHHHKKDVHAAAVSAASSAYSSAEGVASSHSSHRQGGSPSAGTSLSSSHHSSGRPSKSHQQPMMASSAASSVSSMSSLSSSSSNSSVSALTESNLKLNNMKQDIAKKRRAARTAAAVNMTCAQCHTSSSPEWRKGPDGLKSLCNACGLRFSKRTRREIMDDERSRFSEVIMIPLTTLGVVAGGVSDYVTPSPSDYEAATAIASIRNAAATGGALPSLTQPQQAHARRPSQSSLSDALSPSDMAPVSLMPQPQPQPRIPHGLAEVVQNGVPVLPSLASLVPTKALLSPSIDSANASSPFQPLRSPPIEAAPVNPLASVPVRRKRDE